MKRIRTDLLEEMPPSETEKLWIYNGLDCMVTKEVADVLRPQLDDQTRSTYTFERALQGPVLEMRLRGIRVDLQRRDTVVLDLERQRDLLEKRFNRILSEGVGIGPINARSPLQVKALLYDVLKLPPVYSRAKRGYAPSTGREALEKLSSHFSAEPLINYILAIRDVTKKIGTLKSEIDPDNRIRTSFNIAGTDTGRFSSNFSDFGTGTNLQNIEDAIREIFISDPGMKFAYIDLEQAESRLVGAIEWNLFNDGTYLDACESGDLHTSVCKLVWPDLGWTGDPGVDQGIAERPFYRQHSYRYMAKRLGHGTNYRGTPVTMAKHTKVDALIVKNFQTKYFSGFPAHQRWHGFVPAQLLSLGYLISLSGRRRHFFGRRDDDATIRAAIAFDPQGSVGDILNRGMLQVWWANIVQLLLQVHDAILVQYPEEREDEIIPQLTKLIQVPYVLKNGRHFLIPSEVKTGWNWGSFSKDNPDGLRKYKGNDSRRRTEARVMG